MEDPKLVIYVIWWHSLTHLLWRSMLLPLDIILCKNYDELDI